MTMERDVYKVWVLNIFKNMGYKPKTQSCVLFMNEENGVRGGKEYEISLTK
jgi:hypothetical protein